MNQSLVPIAAAAIVVGLLAVGFVVVRRITRRRPPFRRRGSLLTPAELRFYRSLLAAVPEDLAVFLKVRLMDLVEVPDRAWRKYGAPASGMHLDFVLADARTAEPHLVIELDDASHMRPEARKRDAFKNAALDAAGIALLRVRTAERYHADDIRIRIREVLNSARAG